MPISLNNFHFVYILRNNALFICIFILLPIASKSGTFQVQVHEHLLADQTDQEYVKQITQFAKAAEMRNYMNLNVDICENFFDYACGNWTQIYPVESSIKRKTSIMDLFKMSYKHKQYRLLRPIRVSDQHSNDTEDIKKMRDFYKSCVYFHKLSNLSAIKSKLNDILSEFGEMAIEMISTDTEDMANTTDWLEMIAKIKKHYGLNILLKLSLIKDIHNDTAIAIMIGPSMEATASFENGKKKEIYRNLLTYFNVTVDQANALSEEIWNFEMLLKQGNYRLQTNKILLMELVKRKPEELQYLYGPELDLLKLITIASNLEPHNHTIYEYLIDYQKHLLAIISTASANQINNYILYNLAKEFLIDPTMDIMQREEFCLSKTAMYFSPLLDKEIYKTFQTTKMVDDIIGLWENVKMIFKQYLESNRLEWLSPLARKLAMEKLETMSLHIQNYENRNFTQEFHDLYISSQTNYIDNVKAILEHSVNTVNVIEDIQKENIYAPSYLPIYDKEKNIIILPIMLLQPNFLWSVHYPNALKFGTLAFLIARQMIYPFDDDDSAIDTNFVWLDDASRKAFQQRKQCFKNQYSRYRYNGKYLMPNDYQQDNIADTSSIRIAFDAYNIWLHNQTDVHTTTMEHLPNFHLNGTQLFFLSYAQFFCNDIDDTFKEKISVLDNEVPEKLRVIGSLANLKSFSETFNCPIDSTMNPLNKCEMF